MAASRRSAVCFEFRAKQRAPESHETKFCLEGFIRLIIDVEGAARWTNAMPTVAGRVGSGGKGQERSYYIPGIAQLQYRTVLYWGYRSYSTRSTAAQYRTHCPGTSIYCTQHATSVCFW